jgi:agmatine/peptidylarginine deiminase
MKRKLIILIALVGLLWTYYHFSDDQFSLYQISKSAPMTVVLSVPSVHNEYYAEVFDQTIDFHVEYANTLHGNDNVILLADMDTIPYLEGRVPDEIIREAEVGDIWMRDFTTVNPYDPVQFIYGGEYWEEFETPTWIQKSFNRFARQEGVKFRKSNYILDGGNVVDNYKGSIVVTERFLEENDLGYEEGVEVLMVEYGADYVAIIPYDDEIMGHADGMVMFVDDIVFVNRYDEPFMSEVLAALEEGLPKGVEIVEVESDYELKEWKDFSSACGININSIVTEDHIYVPTFGNTKYDRDFIATVAEYTDKEIHTIDASPVCFMGGSVRCLSWQIAERI